MICRHIAANKLSAICHHAARFAIVASKNVLRLIVWIDFTYEIKVKSLFNGLWRSAPWKIALHFTTWGRGGQNAAKFAAGEVVENKQKLNRSFFSYNNSSSISLWQKKAVSPQTYIRDMSTPKNFWRAWGRIGLEIKSPECIEVEEREDFESKQENPKSMLLPLMLVSSLLIFPAAFPELSLQTTIPNPLLSILTKCPFSKDA